MTAGFKDLFLLKLFLFFSPSPLNQRIFLGILGNCNFKNLIEQILMVLPRSWWLVVLKVKVQIASNDQTCKREIWDPQNILHCEDKDFLQELVLQSKPQNVLVVSYSRLSSFHPFLCHINYSCPWLKKSCLYQFPKLAQQSWDHRVVEERVVYQETELTPAVLIGQYVTLTAPAMQTHGSTHEHLSFSFLKLSLDLDNTMHIDSSRVNVGFCVLVL